MMVTAMQATGSESDRAAAKTMQAVVGTEYGPPERLAVQEVDKPAVDADRALVRIRAASINPADLHNVKGALLVRMSSGWRRPKRTVPGIDAGGVVEIVGENVTELRPGDEVFGACVGSLAEFGLGGKNLVPKPANISFEQAASIPIAGITALQGLRDKGQLQPGQTVLINGASGGVGTFAVQIAKALGGTVTAVCGTRNMDMVHALGADHVIDYSKQDFSRSGQRHDLVLDLVGNRSLTALRRTLTPNGTLVLSGGAHERGHGARGLLRPLGMAARGLLLKRFVKQNIVFFIAQINRKDLLTLKDLIEAGKVTPVIDRTYPLSQSGEAFRYLQAGHARGKVAIDV